MSENPMATAATTTGLLALDHAEEKDEERRHREAVADALQRDRGDTARDEYHDGPRRFGPACLGKARADTPPRTRDQRTRSRRGRSR